MRNWLCALCVALCASCPSCLRGELPPALDATDARAIDTALQAIKMTEHDLSFSKTNVESELVLETACKFLQEPLVLAVHSSDVRSSLATVSSLRGLVSLNRAQAEVLLDKQIRISSIWETPLDTDFLAKLPTAVASAVNRIDGDACVAEVWLRESLPKEKNLPFDAFVTDVLQIDKDKSELQNWESQRINTTKLREMLRRGEQLKLEDTELADTILAASDKFDRTTLILKFESLAHTLDDVIAELQTNKFTEEFHVEADTALGRIIVGGAGSNIYTNDAFLIIDTGGDDVYENSAGGANGLVGRPVSIVIDLAGNDQYVSRKSFSQGSGVFGVGILVDCSGDDVYEAKQTSQGAGFFGGGLLADYGGHDKFIADTFCQGAAEFGAGILWQRGGDSEYRAAYMAQGFGGTQGCGLLLDTGGNDSYYAGGKNPCGWLPGHNFSLAQGFGDGMRPFAGGGVGILADLQGDDHYVADVYGQGASYWYAVGLLLDAEGNDRYEAYQYCQGAGIHLSSGALIDWSGDDTYAAHAICQGAAHDYSVGMLIDRAGNDRYTGDTTAQGSAINNSFALLLDRAGNDSYAGTDPKQSQAAGHDGNKREYGSIALMLDLAGKDLYSQGQTNNTAWLKPWYGAGLDCDLAIVGAPFRARPAIQWPAESRPVGRSYKIEPADPHHPIEHLLRRAISEKPDADAAWSELKQQGTNALPYLLTRLDSPNVLVRAKTEDLVDSLGTNAVPALIDGIIKAKNDEVARLCCYFLARFDENARAATPHVLPLVERDKTRATALYTLGHLRAREAFDPAMEALADERELVRLRAAQALGRIADSRAISKLVATLDDEMWNVRYAAQDSLVALGQPSISPLRAAYPKATPRARPHIIQALAKLGDARAVSLAKRHYAGADPLVRDAVLKSLNDQLTQARTPARPSSPADAK